VVEIPASKKKEEAQQREEESDRILEALKKSEGKIWVLDEKGSEFTSVDFSKKIGECRDRGESITFVIGGAYGLSDAVRKRADKIIALSAMTFPHELCRLVFLEQLYRAISILAGSGYHH
jgi:23S rRNA (pseudouridine1915-N3)-methyltransferase